MNLDKFQYAEPKVLVLGVEEHWEAYKKDVRKFRHNQWTYMSWLRFRGRWFNPLLIWIGAWRDFSKKHMDELCKKFYAREGTLLLFKNEAVMPDFYFNNQKSGDGAVKELVIRRLSETNETTIRNFAD